MEFSPLSPDATRVTVKMEYDPEGVVENLGDLLGVTSNRVEGDLERFRDFIESRGHETGTWRGKIGEGKSPRSGGTATSFSRTGLQSDDPGREQVIPRAGVSMPDSVASSMASDPSEMNLGAASSASRAGSKPGALGSASGAGDYARHDPAFRADFDQNYAPQGGRYEDYRDAYYYGCSLRERRSLGAWTELEGDARQDWESKQPGTWERFKNAIRRGWEEITGNA